MLYLFIGTLVLASAAYFLGEAATASARQRRMSVRRAATYGKVRLASRPGQENFRERVLVPLAEKLAGWVLRFNPRVSVEAVAARILAAGLSRTLTPTTFLAWKAALGVAGLVIGPMLGGSLLGGAGVLLFGALFTFGGFKLPDILLGGRAKRRRDEIRADLPDALDLLAVSVEAGLGFDGAMGKITEHMEGPLAEEFGLSLSEMRVGEGRADALRKMTERAPAPELAAFVRAIIQADQLGMSLGRILRVQAADTRLRRQAAAEERAMKAPIKMLFPTVLFIFPAMFLVILGPAFLNLMKVF